jgi:hypothetical protein
MQTPKKRDNRKMCKVVSREGIGIRAAFMDGMLPASVRYLNGARKRYGKSKPLCDSEQRVLDGCLWMERLTGKLRNNAAIVAALANLPHAANASDWMMILCKRGLVDFEDLTIRLRESGRAKANQPATAPTIEELHSFVVARKWGPYQRGLRALIDRYPGAYSRAELGAAADMALESFSLDHSIRSLLRQGLIKYTPEYRLIASAALFPAKAMS